MHTFVDTVGTTWSLVINVHAIKRVRDLAKIDLMAILDGGLVERLYADPVLLVDTLWAIVKPEAEKRAVSDEAFGAAVSGDTIDVATQALIAELVDFFPRGRGKLLRQATEKMVEIDAAVRAAVERRILEMTAEDALASLPPKAGS